MRCRSGNFEKEIKNEHKEPWKQNITVSFIFEEKKPFDVANVNVIDTVCPVPAATVCISIVVVICSINEKEIMTATAYGYILVGELIYSERGIRIQCFHRCKHALTCII